jgi:hypothetical protein
MYIVWFLLKLVFLLMVFGAGSMYGQRLKAKAIEKERQLNLFVKKEAGKL